jgi:hypothetical protein
MSNTKTIHVKIARASQKQINSAMFLAEKLEEFSKGFFTLYDEEEFAAP